MSRASKSPGLLPAALRLQRLAPDEQTGRRSSALTIEALFFLARVKIALRCIAFALYELDLSSKLS
jgi:hypothetical protein